MHYCYQCGATLDGKNPYTHFGSQQGQCKQDIDSVKFNAKKVRQAGEAALKEATHPLKYNPLQAARAGHGGGVGGGARGRGRGRGRGRR